MSLPAVAVSQSPESRFREFLASRPEPRRFTQQHRELVRHIFAKLGIDNRAQLVSVVADHD